MYSLGLLAGAATLMGLVLTTSGVEVPVPAPDDKDWLVAHHRSSVVDSSRKDPFDPSEDRKLAFSLFVPVYNRDCTKNCSEQYMPDQTAKVSNLQFFGNESANVFDKLLFNSCCNSSKEVNVEDYPVIVFEPTVGTSRHIYTQLARQLSANGAAVVTIDHPYDASIVEFDDSDDKRAIVNNGTVPMDPFQVNNQWNDTTTKTIDTRMADIDFVIDHIGKADILGKFWPDIKFTPSLNTTVYYMIGHGLGGTVATTIAARRARVRWSINISGSVPIFLGDVKDYIVFFGRDDYKREDDSNWMESWKRFVGPTVEWDFMKYGHMSFTDLPLIVQFVNPDLKAKGLKEHGIGAYTANSCFLEAYLRDTILGESGQLTKCLNVFKDFVEPHHH